MTITKLGHCCLLLEAGGKRILTDPGMFTVEAVGQLTDIDIILITHEHGDHLHAESVATLRKNNPDATIVTNANVAKLLQVNSDQIVTVEDGQTETVANVKIAGHGNQHAEIYGDWKRVQNTGYFVAGRFFFPGDALFVPPQQPEILALPVAGPWLKLKEAIDYAKDLQPKVVLPVHDGMLSYLVATYGTLEPFLTQVGIEFWVPEAGHSRNFDG